MAGGDHDDGDELPSVDHGPLIEWSWHGEKARCKMLAAFD